MTIGCIVLLGSITILVAVDMVIMGYRLSLSELCLGDSLNMALKDLTILGLLFTLCRGL